MPSILPGYDYDIFISYRHNDNLDGWVSEFVQNLEKELKSTCKDTISVYFDKNPHDGLLETHNVDKSLERKLNCLIFIPILSQTYCDPKSFAWQHEFCAFNKMAKEDLLGTDIRLTSTNVAGRVLPIRIHDLDDQDKAIIEEQLGSVLRAIEFIYKEAGVNRPLRVQEESITKNLNQTTYRNQINKVANGIKDLIAAMQQTVKPGKAHVTTSPSVPFHPSLRKNISKVAVTFMVFGIITFSAFYFMGWGRKIDPVIDKSIAVIPFKNMSGEKDQEYFSDGMMDEVLNQLVKIGDLKVSSRTSSMQYRDSKLPLREIAGQLGVSYILEGSVQKSGGRVRIITQLIDASTDKHVWSETFDKDLSDVFTIQTEISKNIARQLHIVLTSADRKQLDYVPTNNQQAYDTYLKAMSILRRPDGNGNNIYEGIDLLDRVITLDSNFSVAYARRASRYAVWFKVKFDGWEGKDKLANADQAKAEKLSPELVEIRINKAIVLFYTERKYEEALKLLEELKNEYDQNAEIYHALGTVQRCTGLWNESLKNYQKELELDPGNSNTLEELAKTHYAIGNYDEAIKIYKKGKLDKTDLMVHALIRNGELNKALKILDDRPSDDWQRSYFRRDFKKCIEIIDNFEGEVHQWEYFYYPKSLYYARLYDLMGDQINTNRFALQTIEVLKIKIKKSPTDFRIHAALGLAYALAGDSKNAIDAGTQATQIMPIPLDTFIDGPATEFNLASIYLICGKMDEGFDKIEYLLTIPCFTDANISTELLKVDPLYDKFRNLPRFQKILKTEYKTVY